MLEPLAYLDGREREMADLLTRLANLNSYSYHTAGLARTAEALREAFAELNPDEMQSIDLPPARTLGNHGQIEQAELGKLLSFGKRPAAPLQALLVIHYDTVYPPESGFQQVTCEQDPHPGPLTEYREREKDGFGQGGKILRGPGVADAKGGIVVILNALLALERSPLAEKIGWRVLLNPDEEIGSPGSAALLAEAAKKATLALVFEPAPTARTLVTRRKGSGNFSVVFHGRSAHAGREVHKGRNAVLAAARFALEATAAVWALGEGVTINVGRIDGGGPSNVVPNLAILRFNVRVMTAGQQQRVEALLAQLLQAAHRDDITAELHGQFSSPPWVMDERGRRLFDLLRAGGAELGLELGPTSSGGASDANKIAAAGLPVLDSLGPVGADIHSPDERVIISSLVERAKLSALLLMKIAYNPPC